MTRFLIVGALSATLLLGASPAMAVAEKEPASLIVADWFGHVLDHLERWIGFGAALPKMDPDAGEDMPPKDPDGTLGDQVIPRK